MKEWLRETHGPGFELLRHFLRRFFESDVITEPKQMVKPLIGAVSVLLPWFQVLVGPLRHKYAYFSHLPSREPYLQAVRADELWLIALVMGGIGLMVAIRWQSLFPELRDYRALGSLPLRARQIFVAKLMALLIVSTAALLVLNLPASLLFPMVSGGRWALNPSPGHRILVHAGACAAACYFTLFALTAVQGLLLNLLPPRPFARVTGYLQGLLVAVMLVLIVLSFSIEPQIANKLLQPEIARWLPPIWFLGLYQNLLGDHDPAMQQLAHRATWALGIALVLTLSAYLVSYHRHRKLLVEGLCQPARNRPRLGIILDRIIPDPRHQAVIVFMSKTLVGSSQHRMVLMGYSGFGLAVLIAGLLGMKSVLQARFISACFVYAHVILLIFLLLGFRHLFAIPTELRANWTFQLTEGEGRLQWLQAMDRYVLTFGALVLIVIPLPLEIRLLSWRAVSESILVIAFALLCYEMMFFSWEKLPFTCSYLPGKKPMLALALSLLGLLTALPVVNAILLACLYNATAYVIVLALILTAWVRIRSARRESWGELRLKYDDLPEPVITGLNLSR
jgi:hypothetical protein